MKIQLKRSNVLDGGAAKEPTPAQMEFGELAVNYNATDPSIFLKDADGNIIRVAGIGNIADDGQVELPSTINPPANPLPGNLWFNADDGRLYIYYDDGNTAQWVDASPDSWNASVVPDISGDDNQSGTLDDRYLKLGAGAGGQTVAAPEGVEFTGGVKVGVRDALDNIGIASGDGKQLKIYYKNVNESDAPFTGITINNNGRVDIGSNSQDASAYFQVPGRRKTNGSSAYSLKAQGSIENNTSTFWSFQSDDVISSGVNVNNFSHFAAYRQNTNPAGGTAANVYGVVIYDNIFKGTTRTAAFRGSLSDDSKSFNFYADGSAPSFLVGSTYIGGNTTRNTFDLWKSTLTEEQLETLEAGTLVAPANVSLPGDGSFARQWYYDQQDAETQAELTAGTLDYPEHLAAATFTDTFALGDNTNINLESNGVIYCDDRLDVFGNPISSTGVQLSGKVGRLRIARTGNGNIFEGYNGTDNTIRSYIKSEGAAYFADRVGIGTNNPQQALDVNGTVVASKYIADWDFATSGGGHYGYTANTTLNITAATNSKNIYPNSYKSTPTNNTDNLTYFAHFHAQSLTQNAGKKIVRQAAFHANNELTDKADENWGLWSGLDIGTEENFNIYAAGNAPNYFAGLVESAGGVKVTGGTSAGVGNGIKGGTGLIGLVANNDDAITIQKTSDRDLAALNTTLAAGVAFKIGGTTPFADIVGTRIQCEVKGPNTTLTAFDVNPQYTDGSNLTLSSLYQAVLTQDTSLVKLTTQKGFAINQGYNTAVATDNYAFYTALNANTDPSKNNYNFYAAGTAPNYFAGEVILGSIALSDTPVGAPRIFGSSNATLSSGNICAEFKALTNNQTGLIAFTASDGQRGGIQTGNGAGNGIIITGKGDNTTPFLVQDMDARDFQGNTDISNASATVKLLTPKAGGFIAHELQEHLPSAVTGTQDAEEAIGTLADYDGTVLETAVTEPSAEELTYTEDVEVDGVSTATVRTRTWSPTGTQPVYQGVDQTKLIPLLTKALQESLDKIDALEARLNAAGIA